MKSHTREDVMTYKTQIGDSWLMIVFSEYQQSVLVGMHSGWVWVGYGHDKRPPYGTGDWIRIDRETANIFKGCYQADFMAPFIDRLQEINSDPEVAKLLEEAALLYAS